VGLVETVLVDKATGSWRQPCTHF